MPIRIDLIWGNDAETKVFAHAHNTTGTSLTFRITQTTASQPQSFTNRIVARFHTLPVSHIRETFPDRQAMRNALGDAIRQAWPSVVHAAAAPEAVVDLYDDGDGEGAGLGGVHVKWRVRQETALYQEYLDALLSVDDFFPDMQTLSEETIEYVDIEDVVLVDRLPGRGTSALVRIPSEPESLYVMKAIEFADLLDSEPEFIYNRDSFYRSVKVISSMPPHPNIQPPPRMLITSQHKGRLLLRGTLHTFMARGTLDTQVTAARERERRLRPQDKARWALQMSQAVLHTHHAAETYHMDIKPANFLLGDRGDAVLVDWEQSGAPWYTLAPEADGSWDVAETSDGDGSRLVYTEYEGPERVNLPGGHPAWNVFPEWSRKWPKACEAAEVFSLGRTMWLLLQEVPQEDLDGLEEDDLIVAWHGASADIPDTWKATVMQCLAEHPLARIGLADLVNFWEQEQQDIVE